MEKQDIAKFGIIASVFIAITVLGILYAINVDTEENVSNEQPVTSEVTERNDTENLETIDSINAVDGTYTATGEYQSPAGDEKIDVEITISDGRISDVDVNALADNPTSKIYQERFQEGISGVIVGKKINEVEIASRINGSSLTPAGFKEAFDEIIQQASQLDS